MPRTILEPRFQVEYLSILDSDGNLDAALEPDIPAADLKRLYRAMLLGRRLDERMVRLQRQGRIGTFAPIKGQEAAQIGSVSTLRPTDWMVPSFRETAAMLWRGWPIEKLLLLFAGLPRGRPARRPSSTTCRSRIPVATQLPHAVGLAYAAQYRGDDAVVMAYCGDGATSEGDFHEALNFAGVWHVPVVFVVPEQPVGDLGPAQEADALAHDRPEGARLRLPGPPGGRQRRARGLRGQPRGGRAGARRRRARPSSSASPTASACTPPPTIPPSTARRGGRGVGAQGPAHPLRAPISQKQEPAGDGLEEAVDAEIAARRGRASRRPAPPDPLDDVRPRLRRAARRISPPSAPSWPRGCAPGATPPRRRRAEPPAAADARPAHEPTVDAMAKLNMVKALNLALLQEMERDHDVLDHRRGRGRGRRRVPRHRGPASQVRLASA